MFLYLIIICIVDISPNVIDLNGSKGRPLQLKHEEEIKVHREVGYVPPGSRPNGDIRIGFRPNGDLILVLLDSKLKYYRIYLYSFKNRPTANSTLWERSQVYDIEIPESLNAEKILCFIRQTKLFLVVGYRSMIQWNLSTMTFEMQYFFDYKDGGIIDFKIVTNKSQTLLALEYTEITIYNSEKHKTDIYSMETGMRISRIG